MVPVGVVAVPLVGEFIEPIVLDVPAAMARTHDGLGAREELGQAGDPKPFGFADLGFALKPAAGAA